MHLRYLPLILEFKPGGVSIFGYNNKFLLYHYTRGKEDVMETYIILVESSSKGNIKFIVMLINLFVFKLKQYIISIKNTLKPLSLKLVTGSNKVCNTIINDKLNKM